MNVVDACKLLYEGKDVTREEWEFGIYLTYDKKYDLIELYDIFDVNYDTLDLTPYEYNFDMTDMLATDWKEY